MAAITSSPNRHARTPLHAPVRHLPAAGEAPPVTRIQAYDLLAQTTVGAEAATLELGDRKILGRFVTFAAPQRRAIRGSRYRTNDIVMPTKAGGIEVLGAGSTWEEALEAAKVPR
jgi:hypothetical protein